MRDEAKYGRMVAFGEALPGIRSRIDKDLARPGISREKVLAAVVRLLDSTLIRVGNPEYARENNSFGLTTLRDRHVDVSGSTLRIHFRGKRGKEHHVALSDGRLAGVVKVCQDLPGQELFQYVDEDDEVRAIESSDVNDYLRAITGQEFTAKDFRTWGGTVHAAGALLEVGDFRSEDEAKRNVVQAIKRVAEQLGNTPAVCRTCYIHPGVIDGYLDGSLPRTWRRARRSAGRANRGLRKEEAVLLDVLRTELAA